MPIPEESLIFFKMVFSLMFLIFGLVLFSVGLYYFKRKQLIENIPTSKIRSLALGLVEITGLVMPFENRILKSPLEQKDCVYYRYLVEEYHTDSKGRGHWSTVEDKKESVPFYLKDETDSILVDAKEAKIELSVDFKTQNGNRMYTEWCIEPNNNLYILGTVAENESKVEKSANHIENLIIKKGKNEKFYFISDKSEKQILTSFKLRAYGGIVAGVVTLTICCYIYFILK
jgi:hypothetical protein